MTAGRSVSTHSPLESPGGPGAEGTLLLVVVDVATSVVLDEGRGLAVVVDEIAVDEVVVLSTTSSEPPPRTAMTSGTAMATTITRAATTASTIHNPRRLRPGG
jgi:hypothetical protein